MHNFENHGGIEEYENSLPNLGHDRDNGFIPLDELAISPDESPDEIVMRLEEERLQRKIDGAPQSKIERVEDDGLSNWEEAVNAGEYDGQREELKLVDEEPTITPSFALTERRTKSEMLDMSVKERRAQESRGMADRTNVKKASKPGEDRNSIRFPEAI